jgi:tRNA dimethylallyltransferase
MTQETVSPIDGPAACDPLDCWYLTGPTASGKTSVGVELAQLLDAEIISLDSMALYREMDIGTAKPTAEERQRIPHHLLDVLPPTAEFSVSNYREAALAAITEIRARGREVLFVGGTPLYLKALVRGILAGPPADWDFRRRIEEELATVGLEALHERLALVDPVSAARVHPHDKRRMIRALEVHRQTGQPISHLQTQFEDGTPAEECRVFVLDWARDELHRRINARVDRMFADGLVEEVRGLLARHGALSRTASQAVGYREVLAHLRGERDRPHTVEAVKARTRQFARRQLTWFRSLIECRFIARANGPTAREVAEEVLRVGRAVGTTD